MSKNKNSLPVLCYNKKNTHTTVPFGFRWAPFLIFQLFVALLVVQPNAWAGLSSLTVDANGDSVFNGEDEKLSITFTTDDIGAEDRSYTYKISVDHNGDKDIVSSPNAGIGDELSKNQTVQFIWDGTVEKGENREKLPDGVYTIKVVLSPSLEQGEVLELTAEVTIDTKVEKPTISVDYPEFSPVLHSLAVYYTLDEDVAEAWLEFERAAGGAAIGRPISLGKTSGSHTYYWDGEDSNRRSFDDGKYKLKIRIKDKGGNEIVSDATEEITIDTEEPRITGISINDSIPLVSGMYVNASIQTISFTADDPDGTGLDLTGRDTEITIRPDGGKNINGALTTPGNNKAAFTLGNSLDELRENGEYEVIVFISDKVRNLASNRVKFTFDNAVPILKSVATNRSDFTPGTGLSGWTNFVEATLEDNIELNLADSSIRLKGPDGSNVLGQQTRPADNKIRWQLLSPLLAKDGLQDGQYTVEIVGSDKAGNKTTPILITFLFDNLAPELVSLKPTRDGEAFNILGDTVYYNLPLNQFVATFNDGESGTGVAFSGGQEPTRIVFGTPNPDSSITRISGRAFPDQNNDVLTYILNAPLLKTDGSQDGDYSLNVRATDSLGNTKTYTYRIIYDTQVPTLGTTVPAANQTVSNLSEVVVKLNEVTSGIDFVQSTFRLNRGVGENQVEVPVNISSNGADTATLSLLQPIALDGSDDGTYTIEVTPTDLAGNIGAVVRRQFYLVSRTQPQVRLTTPTTGTVNSLDSITVEINNYIGSGINFDASTITVRNAQGLLVPQAEVESDATSNQLTWSTEATIPRNGTADGRYTITATFVDFSGRRFTQSFPIVLDTQFPSVNSVEVITDPQVQLSLNSATDIPETFSQITIVFDENDIDFENTVVSLTGPGETDIALHRSYDGDTLLTLNFQNLAQLGTYTFTLTPIDRIGNVSETPFIYRFRLDIAVPVVTTVLIGGQSGSVVYVNGSASEIVATLVDTTSAGIAVGDGESTIVVTTDSGLPVPGITTTNDENQLIWQPTALPTDGSADGRYTVAITPVDKVGRTGDVAYRSFILDTQAPRISVATPITLHQPISYIGESLTQFQFTAEDVGPALLDLDDQTIVLNKTSGEAVTGQLTHDGNNQLFFTLSAPLPTDGSADGEYVLTVDLVDKAGNPYQLKHNLFYDSQVPRLSAVSLNTETPLSLTPYQVIDLSESISKLTLNFVESTRVDFTETVIVLAGPDGSAIPLTLENNGIDQIVVSFVSLTQGGLYTLSVTPQDIAGNVAQGAVPYPFRLEFEVPGLASVKANSVAASVGLVQHEIIDISESISSLTLAFTDAMRVDFKNTGVVLVGPSGQEIPVTLEDNDGSQLMVRFVSLTQSGLYMLSVTPQDIAGNVAQSAMRYQFRLDIALPTVSSVLIDGELGTNVYANNANINVVVTLFDPTGVGLALGNEGSTIVVTNAEGLVVSGIITSNGTNELTWTPTVLPTDGSADGRYTVTITPVDKSGRSGTIVNRHFILDTQAPRITASTPVTLYQPVSYIGDSLSYFQFTVEDAGPALLDLDDQTIGFKKKSGEVVSGQITNDGSNQLFFTLSAPLPTDGSADGEYVLTVDLVDKAGNPYQIEHNISYDSQAPQLSVVSLNTETPLNLTPYQVTDLSEAINKLTLNFVESTRVDFAETVITLMNPDGSTVPLTLENNGIDQIVVSFVSLTQGGLYTLSVTPQDIAGNVAQGGVPYPFRLEFKVPGLASVKANSVAASVGLVQHEIIDISESISSFTFAFTDAMRVDFKNTGVVLVGPSGQEIPVTLEKDNDGSQLMVRFVSLTQSGLYTLSVTPQDIAGNVAQSAMRYQFRLDIALPTVSSVLIDGKLGTNVYVNNANINVVVTLFDPTGVGLALGDEGSTIVVTNAEGLVVSGIIAPNGTNELTWTPTVLPTDGSADGRYTVTITPVDKSGRSGTIVNRHFILDTQAPRITASTPVTLYQPVSYIGDSLSYFQFTVEDAGPALLDLDDQTIGFKKKSGEVVSGQITNDGSNQLFFTLSAPLPTDGSADGEYVLTVDLVDKAGNPYQIEHNISYDSQAPQLSVVSLNTETPLNLTPYEVTDLSESISKLTLKFVEATRVDFAETVITLMNPDGSAVPLTLENNGIDEITVSFVTLTQGGIYTLSVTPQDIAGNVAQGAVPYPFRLEFEVPRLASVKANSVAASVGLAQHEIIDISESISSLTLAFTDAMRVDFKNTGVVLVGPSGQEIPVTLEDNDGSQLMVRFVSLTQSGLYTLSVTPQDIAGNVAQSAMRYQFRLDIALPTVSSVLIDGKLGTNVYANNANINVVATLFDPTGVGLALGDEGSTIVVTNAEGLVVSGIITSNGTNELTWTPTVLPVDGSADGRYTVTITPIDKSGRSGTIVNRHFILDTQAPRITVSTPVTLYQPVSYIGDSLSYFQFTVEDAGPSLLDLDDQTIGFKKKSGEVVSGQITNDGSNQLFFTLSAPLPTDGSADGEYVLTVDLVDKAGNPYQIEHNISYDSQAPQLSIVSLNTETPLDLTPYQVTDLSESISKLTLKFVEATRVDFAETVITLMSPDGSAVPLTLENNGIDEITVSFVTLTQGGIYTLSVTPQDIAGNVAQGAVPYPFRLKFEVPGLTSVKANTADVSLELTSYEITDITESISNLTLAFTDAVRVDFENTIVTLTGEDGQEIPVTLEDDGNSQLVVRFVSLTQSGMYTLSVTPQDIAGNVAQGAVPYPFRLKFAVPGLASVKANTADVSLELTSYEITDITESISNLTLAFTNAARVDLENTIVTLTGEDGQEIPVTLEDDGNSQLVVRFVSLTQSGMYTLSVTPQDIAGNVAQSAVPYPFRLKFEVLGLTLVKANTAEASLELTSYEITDITESISSLTLAFTDAVRVDFKNTIVTLTGEDGQEIPVTLEDDGNSQLVVRFVSLTQSGMYTLFVTPQDIAGNVAQGAVPYPFRLKFAVPGLTSVKANTADVSSELTSYEITDITESISSLTLAFTDAVRVDFENTIVTLTGEDGQEIPVTLEDDGNSQLVVRFVSLTQSGMYTLSVTPQDEAGNVAQSAIRYQFRLDIALPTVGSVLIDGKPGSAVYVSRSIPKIVATIIDSIGVGVSFGDKGTTIVVTNDQGIQVPGTTTSNGTNQLTWTPTPLPTDGSADGQYTVTITPVDKAGRSGTVVNRQFIYDTQAPRITEATPVTLHAPVSYLGGGLNQFVLTIEDVGPADLLLVSQVVALMDAAGKPVPAALTHDALTNQLYLTLSKPFASDGSVDGAYTLNVLLIDKAGNSLTSRFAVVYDSQVPQVSSIEVNTAGAPTELVTNQVSELSESIDTITIKFNEVTRIDFANTSVSLIDPDDQTIPITQGDDGVSQLTLSFAGLTQIGQYTLSVTPQDIAGNAAQSPIQFQFNLQFILPDVESITIGDTVTFGSADTAYVNADNLLIVANLLDPAGTGLSFDTLTGSDILVATLDDIIVPGTTSTNGTNLIAWRPLTLSDDGSSDGRYAVYVTPVDKKGREGNTIYREFVYDTQKPEITAADPINLSQPVSYISESLTQLQFTLQDVGPADITLADQKVALRNQNGVVIPTKLTNDSNNQIYLTLNESLPLDGSRDGEYTVHIEFSDKAGNVLDVEHPIVYDTQAPTLVSTVPDHGDQLTEDVTEIQVNLDDKGDSGIDWTLTKVTLVNPDGVEISGELTSNGKSQLTLNTNQLVADGKYIIRVQAIDRAGNGSESVFERSFLLSRRLPAIISTLPSTAPQDEAFTNEKVEQVEVMLETADERHLSTLRLLNAASQVVAGQQHRESGKLIYRLVRPLATDGSEDGLYTIEFTPISSSGRSGEIQELVFAYDTQSPELEPETIQLIVAEPEVNNSLTEIRLPLTDNQAGIDWENLDEEWLTFERLSPNATEIAGRVSFDAQDNLIFRLTVPLADNGSADGEYKISVTPTDKAGNGDETYEKVFIYDTSPPMIDPNSLLINDAPLLTDIDAEDYPSAISTSGGVVIQASVTDTGLGVDLSQSRIVVRNPNGAEISGSTQQNGVDTLVFKSDGLTIEGVHQVLITGIGNDSELLGFAPKGSITTKFLYETTAPTAVVTSDGGKTELTDEPLPLEGTAADRQGTRRAGPQGEGEIPVPASGVWLVEIVGTGPDGQPIEPVPTEDESDAQEEPWSRWSVDFLPTRSGEYDIDIRVTDKAGNYAVYDYGKVTMSVSFSFRGNTFGWPNPLRHSKEDVAFFSFDLNASADEKVDLTLYIYDWGGDMVYSQKYTDITPGERNDTQIKWNLENQVGTPVARGLYVFRLEAVNGAGNRANAVGKILVVD